MTCIQNPPLLTNLEVTLPPIDQLLPHEPPMRLIDEVVSYDAENAGIVCRALPTSTCVFVRHGKIAAVLALEYMAQTVAAFVTLRRICEQGLGGQQIKPRVGFIIAARKLQLRIAHFELNRALLTSARLNWNDERTASFDCHTKVEGAVVASVQLLVYEPTTATVAS
jgi:predicted hotdog family 3-hydroxylacyl-ACP dehydratase